MIQSKYVFLMPVGNICCGVRCKFLQHMLLFSLQDIHYIIEFYSMTVKEIFFVCIFSIVEYVS